MTWLTGVLVLWNLRPLVAYVRGKRPQTDERRVLEHPSPGLRTDPAPERWKRMPWSTFLKAHWEAIAAAQIVSIATFTHTAPSSPAA